MTDLARDIEELRGQLRVLDERIEALDQWTDKHPYPSGMDKLWRLRRDREDLAARLNRLEYRGMADRMRSDGRGLIIGSAPDRRVGDF
jgi:hypothetical protein